MSDKTRNAVGIVLICTAFLMSAIPGWSGLLTNHPQKINYCVSGTRNSSDCITAVVLPNGTISVNQAEKYDLTGLHGIGETLAGMIILERQKNGDFMYPEDLTAVRGIGPARIKEIREMLDLD